MTDHAPAQPCILEHACTITTSMHAHPTHAQKKGPAHIHAYNHIHISMIARQCMHVDIDDVLTAASSLRFSSSIGALPLLLCSSLARSSASCREAQGKPLYTAQNTVGHKPHDTQNTLMQKARHGKARIRQWSSRQEMPEVHDGLMSKKCSLFE